MSFVCHSTSLLLYGSREATLPNKWLKRLPNAVCRQGNRRRAWFTTDTVWLGANTGVKLFESSRRRFSGGIGRRDQKTDCRSSGASKSSLSNDVDPKVILVTERIGSQGLDMLNRYVEPTGGEVRVLYDLNQDQLWECVSDVHALIVRSGTPVDRNLLSHAPKLQVVGRAGVGLDNIDISAATEHGCLVVNAPHANTVAAAEHAIALLCSLARNIPQADHCLKSGIWNRHRYIGVSLTNKTLALIGLGKVGAEVAKRAVGLGLEVVAHDPYCSQEKALGLGVELVSFNEALARGDFFSLHIPLSDATRNLVGATAFSRMKRGAMIVNGARGGVLEERALQQAIQEGQIAGAALDVFSKEPPDTQHPLLQMPQVICTPHLGSSTREAQEMVAVEVAEAVMSGLKGVPPETAINAPVLPKNVISELMPYVTLAERLGRFVYKLLQGTAPKDVHVEYTSTQGEDLDPRLLRAMVIKGLVEPRAATTVNLVNSEVASLECGLRITEARLQAHGCFGGTLESIAIEVRNVTPESCPVCPAFTKGGYFRVRGVLKDGVPMITHIGEFELSVALDGKFILVRNKDSPGQIGAIGTILAKEEINIQFVACTRNGGRIIDAPIALVGIGVDNRPSTSTMEMLKAVDTTKEVLYFSFSS